MNKHKLVPVEPTLEMVEAMKARLTTTSRGGILNAGHALADAISSAPAVQGEPVAHLRRDQLQQIKTRGPVVGEISPSPRGDMVAVYTAPQPAPDVTALVEVLEQYADDYNWCYDTCNIGSDVAKKALAALSAYREYRENNND